MQLKNETQTRLGAEIKIIPGWAWTLAVIGVAAGLFMFNIVPLHPSDAPPPWARPLLGLLAGTVLGCYVLLIGYVNRDARRRGMSTLLWTIVAIFIPNGLGIILYFILRQPLCRICSQCGNAVQMGFNFCPRCSHRLSPSCPRCQRVVSASDVYCPYCGTALGDQTIPV
ncbi:MAG: zinc ribbon domain-containing protein [Bryobacteraceae bacterium]